MNNAVLSAENLSSETPIPLTLIPLAIVDAGQPWLTKLAKKHIRIAKKHEKARTLIAEAYEEFSEMIDQINLEQGTDFTDEDAKLEFQNREQ